MDKDVPATFGYECAETPPLEYNSLMTLVMELDRQHKERQSLIASRESYMNSLLFSRVRMQQCTNLQESGQKEFLHKPIKAQGRNIGLHEFSRRTYIARKNKNTIRSLGLSSFVSTLTQRSVDDLHAIDRQVDEIDIDRSLTEGKIIDFSPNSRETALLKLRILSEFIIDGVEIDLDHFAFLIYECVVKIEDMTPVGSHDELKGTSKNSPDLAAGIECTGRATARL